MARRRSRTTGTSLDLFLDTICNAFGGIMFISILIAILVQMRGGESETPPSSAPRLTEAQAKRLAKEFTVLQREGATLREAIAFRESMVLGEDQQEILERQRELQEASMDLDAILQRQTQLLATSIQIRAKSEEIKQELSDLDGKLRVVRAKVQDLSHEVAKELDQREIIMTIPRVRATTKDNILCAMRYGKLYLVTDPDSPLPLEIYRPHVTEFPAASGVRVAPIPSAGWRLSEPADRAAWMQVLVRHPSQLTFVSCAVWPDSFAEFAEFKALLNTEGYDYQLVPVEEVPDLLLGPGSGAMVQ